MVCGCCVNWLTWVMACLNESSWVILSETRILYGKRDRVVDGNANKRKEKDCHWSPTQVVLLPVLLILTTIIMLVLVTAYMMRIIIYMCVMYKNCMETGMNQTSTIQYEWNETMNWESFDLFWDCERIQSVSVTVSRGQSLSVAVSVTIIVLSIIINKWAIQIRLLWPTVVGLNVRVTVTVRVRLIQRLPMDRMNGVPFLMWHWHSVHWHCDWLTVTGTSALFGGPPKIWFGGIDLDFESRFIRNSDESTV